MRRIVLVLFAVLASMSISVSLASAASAAGDAGVSKKTKKKKKAKPAKPRITILNASSSKLAKGKVKVKVKGSARAAVKLSGISSTFDVAKAKLVAPKRVKLNRRGLRTVALKLTPAARKAVAGCSPRNLVITGKSGKKTGKARKAMVRNTAACKLSQVNLDRAADCEFIAQPKHGMCMLPFPSDYYTVEDKSSPTGKRIRFTEGAMPQNDKGVPIDPSNYRYSDGFSQGQGIALKIPGLDSIEAANANKLVPINHIGRYADSAQRVVVIDTKTNKRWPIWANVDSNASADQDRLLEIKPAKNFSAGGRYIVALRNLTDVKGKPLVAPEAFRYYRDQIKSSQKQVNDRRTHFEGIFKTLRKAGIKRSELYLAWDFTVASDENNYRRVLSMRDRAFAELGDTNLADNVIEPGSSAPDFKVDSIESHPNPRIARYIKGSFTVPCFVKSNNGGPDCNPGSTMDLDEDGLPKRHGNWEANMECIVPQTAADNGGKMRPMVFGHGLFGRADGVTGSVNPILAEDHKMLLCATDEIGMSGEDPLDTIYALKDLSKFKMLPDRLAQAIVNELFLARLMYHPQGLGTDPAFQKDGESLIDTQGVYYMGASQGGILGGALTAVSPDFTQASLLVGAMNYSTLLPRSIDFDLYAGFLYPAYPNEMARPLLFGLMQMLWDRSEPNGYAHRMTDNPPPNTPKHNVTLQIALGDHEVTNFAAEVQARTVGMATIDPPIDATRWPDFDVLWDVPRIKPNEYPYHGSNIVYFDGGPMRNSDPNNPNSSIIGTPPPPFENIPPRSGQNPHGAPGGATMAVQMTSDFLQPNGYIDDICAPKSCYSDVWGGMP